MLRFADYWTSAFSFVMFFYKKTSGKFNPALNILFVFSMFSGNSLKFF